MRERGDLAAPASGIFRIDASGNVVAYPSISAFLNDAGTAAAAGGSVLADAVGFFSFAGSFYTVKQGGVVVEYETASDFANDVNGTVLGTVAAYANDVGYLGAPVGAAPAVGALAGSLLAVLVAGTAWNRIRRR